MGIKVKGLEQVMSRIQQIPERLQRGAEMWVRTVTHHAAERAEVNAPILSGQLRAKTIPVPLKIAKNHVEGGVRSFAVNPRTGDEYAHLMHEFQFPAGGFIWRLGPKTQMQPKTVEGGPGGKYIKRVVDYHEENYQALLAVFVTKALKGEPVTGGLTGVVAVDGAMQPSSPAAAVTGS